MNVLFLVIAFFLIGVAVYYLDLTIIKLPGKWFPKKFPQGKAKGLFVVGRLFRHRLLIAFIIVIAEVVISIWYGKADFQEDLIYGLIELVGLMAGFYGAAWFLRYAPKRFNEALDYAERVESGKTDVAEDLKNTMKKVNITAKISTDSGKEKSEEEKKTPAAVENPDIPSPDDTKVTSKDLDKSIDDFIKKDRAMAEEQVAEPKKRKRFREWFAKRPLWAKIVLIILALVVLELVFTGRSTYQVLLLGLRKYTVILTLSIALIVFIIYRFRKSKLRGRVIISIILLALIGGFFLSGLAPWEMYSYLSRYVRYKTLNKINISELPETAYEPIQPRISIQTLAEQRVRETEAVTEPFLVRDSSGYRWTMALQPSPKYNYQRFFESTQAIFSVSTEAPSPNFSEEHKFPVHFTIGERLLFSRATHTAVIRSFSIFQLFMLEPGETRYMRDDNGEWVEVTPLICWKGFLFPRPEFGGVHVIKQGATDFVKRVLFGAGKIYSPTEMKQFKYLQNQNLMPEKVSRYATESFRFQEGFLAPLPMYHKGDVRIPEIKDGISKEPMTAFFKMSTVVPGANDMLYQYYALEPYDTTKHGLNTSIFIPADGEMQIYIFNHKNDGTAGTTSVPSKIRESKMSYDWSVNKVADVRPYFRNIDGKVRPLWLASVVTSTQTGDRYLSGGVPAIAVVDAKYDRVVWLNPDKPESWNAQIEQELGSVWKQ